jgi:hypothetical protein
VVQSCAEQQQRHAGQEEGDVDVQEHIVAKKGGQSRQLRADGVEAERDANLLGKP